jgi:4-amino-4-deoxy-L-arabinose transferase-like glycosyltransferase
MHANARFLFLNQKLSPRRLFWLFVITHAVLWTLLPTFLSPNAPLDVIEGYTWGREWPLGTYKHPPMQAWVLETLAYLTGRADWAHFLASQLAIVVAFWAVWQTGLRIVGALPALVGVLLLEGVVYYNFTSPEFNPNLLQLPFWAMVGLYYHRAIKEDGVVNWLWLGLWSAAGLYSKYSTGLLLLSLMILTLARPEGRRRLSGIGPYLSVAIACGLFAPHIVWLFNHHFQPFMYARDRLQSSPHIGVIHSAIVAPSLFVVSQFLAVLPALLIFISVIDRRPTPDEAELHKFDKLFLATMTFGPCFLVLIMASFFGLSMHDMWATPFWNFLGLWVVSYFQPVLSSRALRRMAYSGIFVLIGLMIAYIGGTFGYPYATGKGLRVHFPGRALAKRVSLEWTHRYGAPLSYVIGDTWPAGNIAYYAVGRPHVFIGANTEASPWIDPALVTKNGGVIVWCIEHCSFGNRRSDELPAYLHDYPRAEIQPPLTLPRLTSAPIEPVIIGWAILPPG